jgi:chloramphenicol-sensitive protein RarD
VQFLTPVLQFAVGVGIRHEQLPGTEWIGFGLVWLALIVLTVDGLRAGRRRPADPVSLGPRESPDSQDPAEVPVDFGASASTGEAAPGAR